MSPSMFLFRHVKDRKCISKSLGLNHTQSEMVLNEMEYCLAYEGKLQIQMLCSISPFRSVDIFFISIKQVI